MNNIILDAARLSERESAHDELAEKFGFPEYYGRNLDALADCLGEISEQTVVTVSGEAAGYCGRVFAVLNDAASQNTMLKFVPPEGELLRMAKPFFESFEPPVLKQYPAKQKKQLAVLTIIAEQFEPGRTYTEPEVNAILRSIHEDYAGLRRALIDFGLMERSANCSEYRRA